MPLVVIASAVKRYRGRFSLAVDHLEIVGGDRVLVMGGNGSGKSTLLRVVVGLARIESGMLTRAPDWPRLKIGYLPQEGGIWRDLTISENAAAFGRLLGRPTAVSTTELAAQLGIVARDRNKRVGELSGGTRRLAAICALLSTAVDGLVLDEPSSALDVERRLQLYDVLRDCSRRLRFLIATEHVGPDRAVMTDPLWTQALALKGEEHHAATALFLPPA